jgi:hypothetical protein
VFGYCINATGDQSKHCSRSIRAADDHVWLKRWLLALVVIFQARPIFSPCPAAFAGHERLAGGDFSEGAG